MLASLDWKVYSFTLFVGAIFVSRMMTPEERRVLIPGFWISTLLFGTGSIMLAVSARLSATLWISGEGDWGTLEVLPAQTASEMLAEYLWVGGSVLCASTVWAYSLTVIVVGSWSKADDPNFGIAESQK